MNGLMINIIFSNISKSDFSKMFIPLIYLIGTRVKFKS
jgi:hypothetical protein